MASCQCGHRSAPSPPPLWVTATSPHSGNLRADTGTAPHTEPISKRYHLLSGALALARWVLRLPAGGREARGAICETVSSSERSQRRSAAASCTDSSSLTSRQARHRASPAAGTGGRGPGGSGAALPPLPLPPPPAADAHRYASARFEFGALPSHWPVSVANGLGASAVVSRRRPVSKKLLPADSPIARRGGPVQ